MEWMKEYKYALTGASLALVLMLLMFSFGFFKTILLLLGVGLGAFGGMQLKDTDILENLVDKLKATIKH